MKNIEHTTLSYQVSGLHELIMTVDSVIISHFWHIKLNLILFYSTSMHVESQRWYGIDLKCPEHSKPH